MESYAGSRRAICRVDECPTGHTESCASFATAFTVDLKVGAATDYSEST